MEACASSLRTRRSEGWPSRSPLTARPRLPARKKASDAQTTLALGSGDINRARRQFLGPLAYVSRPLVVLGVGGTCCRFSSRRPLVRGSGRGVLAAVHVAPRNGAGRQRFEVTFLVHSVEKARDEFSTTLAFHDELRFVVRAVAFRSATITVSPTWSMPLARGGCDHGVPTFSRCSGAHCAEHVTVQVNMW